MTVAELPEFSKEAARILGDVQHAVLIAFLGNPQAGVVVPDTGGNATGENMSGTKKILKSSKRKPLEDRLADALQQAKDFLDGKNVPGMRVHIPASYDVGAIRRRMKLSQKDFAARFGFSIDSVQNWEQGRRVPDGPARTLLAVIAHEPKAVERALEAAAG